jgi:tRNA pseudouridine32 synthase / 23S rRNA pseudouridine746 synthase
MIDPSTELPVILYEDEHLILINKPGGLLSVADGYDPTLPQIKSVIEPRFGRVWMVHRLDKDTSGVMLIARNEDIHRILNADFRLKKIEKIYHGLVTPVPTWREKDIQLPLLTDADRKHRTRVSDHNGKEAHSVCRVIKWYECGVVMEIQIHSGVSHQIRAHLRAFDLALLGDALYSAGLPPQPFPAPRTMLHARTLNFRHPITGEWRSLTASYPEDFRAAYTQLRTSTAQDTMI